MNLSSCFSLPSLSALVASRKGGGREAGKEDSGRGEEGREGGRTGRRGGRRREGKDGNRRLYFIVGLLGDHNHFKLAQIQRKIAYRGCEKAKFSPAAPETEKQGEKGH